MIHAQSTTRLITGRRRPVVSGTLSPAHLVGQRRVCGLLEFVLVLCNERWVDLDLWRGKRRGGDKFERLVAGFSWNENPHSPDQLAGKPEERLFKVVLLLASPQESLNLRWTWQRFRSIASFLESAISTTSPTLSVESNVARLDLAFLA